ncbi:thioesterase II family protein [Streptomyces decoyicus]|uniref:thioesterase II family protein n=1 Tax=Streptomyces decoyicus TaxID=249567 RepID=UPI0033A905FA
MSDVVLRTPGLLSRFLPCIRADLEVAETCSLAYDTSLDCPVHAFAGADDRLVTPDMVRAWSTVTTGTFDFHLFPGGHFFIQTSQRQVVDRVLTALGPLLSPTALVGPAATQEVHIPTAEFPRRKSG